MPLREEERGGAGGGPGRLTFGLGAEPQEAVGGEQLEEGPHAVGVPAHAHLPVGRVQQDEGEDAVQEGRHLLGAEAVVEVEQDLPVHLRLVVEAKLLPQLQGGRQGCRRGRVPGPGGTRPGTRGGLTLAWL